METIVKELKNSDFKNYCFLKGNGNKNDYMLTIL